MLDKKDIKFGFYFSVGALLILGIIIGLVVVQFSKPGQTVCVTNNLPNGEPVTYCSWSN